MSTLTNSIPKQYSLTNPIHSNKYLVNGILKEWSGNKATVYSNIYYDNDQPTLLSTVPDKD